ncbi:MAG TPA: hypothetical protein DCP31_09975 [Cyanobacteria bacterium UBA8543]|nr:hypothetical protein [Cyanobacteria bacterium UBA8543]
MAQVQICVRNQNGNAMVSVDGIAFITLLASDGRTIGQQSVTLRYADADFPNLEPGSYTAMVSHPSVEPTVARYDFGIQSATEIIQVFFMYSEPERVLLRSFMELRAR